MLKYFSCNRFLLDNNYLFYTRRPWLGNATEDGCGGGGGGALSV